MWGRGGGRFVDTVQFGTWVTHTKFLCLVSGDEKHMVFECSALQHIRDEYPALFVGHHTMRSFMNQADQRSIIHFISECLDCSNDMVGAV